MYKYEKIAYLILFGGLITLGIGYLYIIEFNELSQLLYAFGLLLTFIGFVIYIFTKVKILYKIGLSLGCFLVMNTVVEYALLDGFLLQSYIKRHHHSLLDLDSLINKHPEIDRLSWYRDRLKIESKYSDSLLLTTTQKKAIHQMMDSLGINSFTQEHMRGRDFYFSKKGNPRNFYSNSLTDGINKSELYILNDFLYEHTKGKDCRVDINNKKELCIECDISDYYADHIRFRARLVSLLKTTKVKRITRDNTELQYLLKGFYRLYKKNEPDLKKDSYRYGFPVGYGFSRRYRR